jgi:4'-phosphopantetheinyl transferase
MIHPADVSSDQTASEDRLVTVWRVGLDLDERAARTLGGHLAADELEQLEHLRGSEVARRWSISRGALREILGAELGVAPSSVQLRLGDHGRPRLDPAAHERDLDFNLSHSADLALVAAARGRRVGIDVERLRPGRNPLRAADRYFSIAEVAAVRAFPEADRPLAFLRYWTAKEALAKGLGLGLQAPSGDLELAQQPGGRMAPVRLAGDWHLTEIGELPEGYFGTLAVDGPAARIVVREWQPGQMDR